MEVTILVLDFWAWTWYAYQCGGVDLERGQCAEIGHSPTIH